MSIENDVNRYLYVIVEYSNDAWGWKAFDDVRDLIARSMKIFYTEEEVTANMHSVIRSLGADDDDSRITKRTVVDRLEIDE